MDFHGLVTSQLPPFSANHWRSTRFRIHSQLYIIPPNSWDTADLRLAISAARSLLSFISCSLASSEALFSTTMASSLFSTGTATFGGPDFVFGLAPGGRIFFRGGGLGLLARLEGDRSFLALLFCLLLRERDLLVLRSGAVRLLLPGFCLRWARQGGSADPAEVWATFLSGESRMCVT